MLGARCSEGAGEREDVANRVMLMGGPGLSLSHGLRMLPTATCSSWENIWKTNNWKNGFLCKSNINSLLEITFSYHSLPLVEPFRDSYIDMEQKTQSYAFILVSTVFPGLPCTWSPELGMTFQVQTQQC